METPVKFLNKIIGHIKGDTFTTIRTPLHFFRKYNGFALSKKVIGYLASKGVTKVTIVYTQSINKTKRLNIPLQLFFTSPYTYVDKSNGIEDPQKIVSLPNEVICA